MKHNERPAWMAASRHRASQPAKQPPRSNPPRQPAAPEPQPAAKAAPRAKSDPGYNPYDTVVTRTADLWRFKPKRG